MIDLKQREAWFITGSQGLYGKETLDKVAEHAREIARELSASPAIPVTVVFKPVVTSPDAILEVCREANSAKNCVGLRPLLVGLKQGYFEYQDLLCPGPY